MEDKKIFFSYSRNDASEFALNLAEELRNANADIWIDQLDIHGGAKWDLEIEKALKASTCVLFIVSEESIKSDHVLDEVYYALNKKKQVIPVIVNNCEVPYRIERLQQIDFIKDYKSGLNRLFKALNLKLQTGSDRKEDAMKESGQVQGPVQEAGKLKSISKNESLTGYGYDIFISCSFIDNIHLNNKEHGWVELFYNHLKVFLAQHIGIMDAVKIWWNNKESDGSISFDPANEDAIKRSAIMLCLTSPSYLKSRYCLWELDTFCKKVRHENLGLEVGNRSRLLNVLLYNIPYKQWPKEFSGTTGFPFNNAEGPEDMGKLLTIEDPEYKVQLRKLGDSIIRLIEEFPKAV